jgi:GNAT superfamily N-acetyltransferase
MVAEHEAIEETAETDWFRAASPEVVAATGLRVEDQDSARLYLMPHVDVLMFNRAVGIGIRRPATERDIDRIVASYRDLGVSRFLVSISPAAKPVAIASWLEARGFRRHNAWVKLHRETERMPVVATMGVRVEEIGPDRALEFGKIVQTGFSMTDVAGEWVGLTVGRSGWRHYLALDGTKPVAAAAMHLRGSWAWFGFMATLEEARGRGAQSALIAAADPRRARGRRALAQRRNRRGHARARRAIVSERPEAGLPGRLREAELALEGTRPRQRGRTSVKRPAAGGRFGALPSSRTAFGVADAP